MTRSDSLVPSLITLFGVVALLALGAWQLDRRADKHALIATLESRLSADPVPLPARIDDPKAWAFRRVTLTGRFVDGRDLLLSGRPRQGQAGYELVSLFQPDDGGPAVLVNRGFVPLEWRDPAARPPLVLPAGALTPAGVARLPAPRLFMQPENDPVKMGAWVWLDMPAVQTALGAQALAPLVVELQTVNGETPQGRPEPNRQRIDLPDNHLLYALTWWALAAALAAVYIFWRRLKREHDSDWNDA